MPAKKTTLMIDDRLYEAVRLKALKQGKSVSATVSEALRRYVSAAEEKPRQVVDLPVLDGVMLLPPEIYTSNAALQELMDAEAFQQGGIDKIR